MRVVASLCECLLWRFAGELAWLTDSFGLKCAAFHANFVWTINKLHVQDLRWLTRMLRAIDRNGLQSSKSIEDALEAFDLKT